MWFTSLLSPDFKYWHSSFSAPAPKGGTLRLGVYGSFDNLNRIAFKGSKAAGLGYINDTLMRRVWDEAFTLYGLIAEFVEMPEDRSSITFYINSKAKFHDGSALLCTSINSKCLYYLYHFAFCTLSILILQ